MNKNITILLLAAISILNFDVLAQTATEIVNVSEPGTLRELVNDLPGSRLKNLTINGSLNGKDIAYLVGGTGKMVSVDTLDISKISLVGDDEPYKQLLVETSDVGFGTTTEVYYLSERDTIIYDGHSTGLGGYAGVHHVFCKDLSGAFAENNSFKRILMPENLTKIGSFLFFNNSSVSTVELPKKATVFGKRAFDGASALTKLCIPDGIVAIPERSIRCSSLEDVVLPSTVDSICNQAFELSPIQNVNLQFVKYVGKNAFYGNKFTGILNISSLSYMGRYAFYGSNEIESILFSSNIKEIPDYAFSGAGLSSLELPSNIVSIGDGAFSNCENLSSVIFSPNIVNISNNSFSNTPWQSNLKGDNGVIYAGTIALAYNSATAPKDGTFSFRDGTTAIANIEYRGFFPTFQDNWHLEKIYLPESLLRIGNNVFNNCKELKEIKIPESLIEIGSGAFSGCESLQYINLPEGLNEISNYSFQNCKNLQEINFPNNIKRIGENAFENASNMYFSELPSSLKVIESGAFSGCKAIPTITLPEDLDSIYKGAFYGCIGIETIRINSKVLNYAPGIFQKFNSLIINNDNNLYQVIVSPEVTILPDGMFGRCTGLQKVKFEDNNSSSLKKIGASCFVECSKLSINELPSSLDSIGDRAFSRTLGYEGVLNTKNISYIGYDAFGETPNITELIISSPHIYIGYGAFGGCDNLSKVSILSEIIESDRSPFNLSSTYYYTDLKNVEIGSKLKSIPKGFFANISTIDSLIFQERGGSTQAYPLEIEYGAFERCWLRGSLKLPEGTVRIGEYAFANNDLTEVTIPNSCKIIDNQAFASNQYISDITIGDGIEYIGEYAFTGCKLIKSISIPATCKEIGNYFIHGCSSLQSLYFISDEPPVFMGELGRYTTPTIFVPYQSLEKYKQVPELRGFNIEVNPYTIIPVKSIALSPNRWCGVENDSFNIEATIQPEDATDKTLTWTSSDQNIATVDRNGNVKAISIGEAVITASCGDVSATCKVSVIPTLAESITLDPAMWSGEVGSEFTIKASVLPENTTDKTLVWSSSNEKVATVDADGHVKTLTVGEAVITATCGNISATCNVTVLPILIESLTIDPTEWNGTEGNEFTIIAKIMPDNATNKTLVFASSDTSIATVNSEGHVLILKEGSCKITVTTIDGSNLEAECKINSISGIDYIFSNPNAEIDVFDTNGIMIKHSCTREVLKQLTPAVYIIRSGNTVCKLVIR